MTREEVKLELAGPTQEHFGLPSTATQVINGQQHAQTKQPLNGTRVQQNSMPLSLSQMNHKMNALSHCIEPTNADSLSTIAILRRHPMYDSLVLVKKFRPSINGHILELPTSELNNGKQRKEGNEQNERTNECSRTKLISVYLDGDDPIYQSEQERYSNKMEDGCELVYVPMNGLIDRLDNYDKQGVAIDSRVYAFAMGLKTAEKFLTSSAMKEIQETPPL